jgi:hypothetical protein
MDPEVVALAEEQTAQTEAASTAAVEIEEVREEGSTERAELYEEGATERAQIAADAAVAIANAESGVDEEWLRSQFAESARMQAETSQAVLGLTAAVTQLVQTLASPPIPTPPVEVVEEVIPPTPAPPEPMVEPGPVQAAPVKTRRNVLF